MSPRAVPARSRATRAARPVRTEHPVDRTRPRRPASAPSSAAGLAATALAAVPLRRSGSEERRPSLRVVDDSRVRLAARRKRMRVLLTLTAVVVCASVFALAGFHAMLLQGQTRLDALNRAVAEEQVRYDGLRYEVAVLESPERIVAVAQEELGMVPPEDVEWLAPTATPPAPSAAGDGQVAAGDDAGRQAPWAAIKPYLGSRR